MHPRSKTRWISLEASRMEARRRKRSRHATADQQAADEEVPQDPSDHDVAASSGTEVDLVQPEQAQVQSGNTNRDEDIDVIHDLLELAECDLPVSWPRGWSLARARAARQQRTGVS